MGHFENGIWIETKSSPLTYTIHVDTSEIQQLEEKLTEIRDLYTIAESMTTLWQRLRWLLTGKVR